MPSAVLSGVARAARGGVLIKGGAPLENLGKLSAMAFDKTGTLTEGKPRLVDVLTAPGVAPDELLAVAQAVALAARLVGTGATIVMPDDAMPHKVAATRAYGAEIILTPQKGGMEGARDLAEQMVRDRKGVMLDQFSNPDNPAVRADGTLKLSEDEGRTWKKAFRYAKKPAPNLTGYSDIAVMPDGSVGILHERGDLEDASRKRDRYDEVGFIVVPFAEIRTPLPSRG